MPWIKQGGKLVRVEVGVSPQEVTVTREFHVVNDDALLECPHCDKEYKTQSGLDNHLDNKH